MCGPPDPNAKRAALAGSPVSQNLRTEDSSLAASDFQALKLRRLFALCQATACTIANLAWGAR
jgi:hypothetical protein